MIQDEQYGCCISPITMDCAIENVLSSIASQETSIAHIINAESEKLESVISMPEVSFEDIMLTNKSIKNTLEALLQLEQLLQRKLGLIITCIDTNS